MLNVGFSLLKSLGKSASKRKRERDATGDAESPGDLETDSATKRARMRAGGSSGDGSNANNASFITSSARKTKGKTPVAARRAADDAARDLRREFQSLDDVNEGGSAHVTRARANGASRKPESRGKNGGMMSIFSPVFAYFGGGRREVRGSRSEEETETTETETETRRDIAASGVARKSVPSGGLGSGPREAKRKDSSARAARGKAASSARWRPERRSAAGGRPVADATEGTRDSEPEPEPDEASSFSDDDVPVAGAGSPALAARLETARSASSLESDEAEETESDDALLAAGSSHPSSRSGADPSGERPEPRANLVEHPDATSDGIALQNGFGKANVELEDEYEYEDEMDDENYDEEYDPWIFIGGLPPLNSCVPRDRPKLLPQKTAVHRNKNTLVLDLDETLVHSDLDQTAGTRADFSFPVRFNDQKHIVNVRRRPYLAEFMEFAARHFEVVVFTASQRVYAERLLDTLDPDAVLITHRLYREACVLVDGNYMKDLSAIGRDLRTTIIVDNSPQAFGFQTENGVPIDSWFDDSGDAQLLKLMPLLGRLAAAEDVRPVLRAKFNLEARIRDAERKADMRANARARR